MVRRFGAGLAALRVAMAVAILLTIQPAWPVEAQVTACFAAPTPPIPADLGGFNEPSAIATGDFNGDGKPDLAIANFGAIPATVSIRLGNGNGSFGNGTDVGVVSHPIELAVGDFNGDDILDLAVVNYSGGVSIRLGVGDGTFTNAANVAVGTGADSIAIGDLNGDGKPDLAVANFGADTVSIRLGNANGTFTNVADVAVGTSPGAVALGQLNVDGRLDLAVANVTPGTVSIRLNSCGNDLVPQPRVPPAQTVPEDSPLVFGPTHGNAIVIADDGRSTTMHVTLTAASGTLSLGITDGLRFEAGNGTADPKMTFAGTLAQVNAALTGLRFCPLAQYNGLAQLTITVRDDGHAGGGSPSTNTESISITVTAVNDAPTAVDDSYAVVAQTTLTVAAPGVLANDTDVDSPAASLTAAVVASPAHGNLTLNPNGSFSYTPVAGFAGTDTFTYRTSDSSEPSGPATVSITVAPIQCVPRPRVATSPVAGGGRLTVHVEATPLNTQQNNPLQRIVFGTLQNAKATLNGQSITSGQTYAVPAGVVFVDLTVERVTPGQATTVPFTVVDGCGEWPTFVGGGTAAGF